MSYEKIQLPEFLIRDLYKDTLVDLNTFKTNKTGINTEKQVLENEVLLLQPEKIKFWGENKKMCSIIISETEATYLREEDVAFLTNILKACQLNVEDIAIINIAKQAIDYTTLKEQLNPKKILLFDVEPSTVKLPFLIPSFQLQQFDGCTIMVAPPLSHLNKSTAESKLLKTKLWMSLKQVFNI